VCRKPLSEHDITDLQAHYESEQKAIQTDLKTAQAQLKQMNKTLQQLDQQITQARQEQESLATEAQLSRQQEAISSHHSEVADLQQQVESLSDAPNQIALVEKELDAVQQTLEALETQLAEMRQADESDQTEQNQLQDKISQLARPVDLSRLQTEIEEMQANLTQWGEDIAKFSDAPAQVDELKTRYQTLEEQKLEKQEHSRQVNNERETLGQKISQLQTEMGNLASPDRMANLEGEIEKQQQILTDWLDKVTTLSEAPTQLEAVTAALAELDNPRVKQQLAQRPGLKQNCSPSPILIKPLNVLTLPWKKRERHINDI
jgi:chromosome segregation ATPase